MAKRTTLKPLTTYVTAEQETMVKQAAAYMFPDEVRRMPRLLRALILNGAKRIIIEKGLDNPTNKPDVHSERKEN